MLLSYLYEHLNQYDHSKDKCCTVICQDMISKRDNFERVFGEVNENVFGIKTNGMSSECVRYHVY